MNPSLSDHRRKFLRKALTLSLAAMPGAWWAATPASAVAAGKDDQQDEIPPTEDLMREHGLLNRILLIYEEHLRRLHAHQDFDPAVLASAAEVIHRFVEDYHEKLEEEHLFPRFRKAGKMVDLVDTLLAQHQAGRRVTDEIQRLSNAAAMKDGSQRDRLASQLQVFVRMYRPHEAREDTILFPAFRTLVSGHEFGALGEDFERKENQLFGHQGFETMVARVAELEKRLGIYDLAQFTPA